MVPLATGWTLGMTLRPQRGGCDGKGANDGPESGQGFFPIKSSNFWELQPLNLLFMMW